MRRIILILSILCLISCDADKGTGWVPPLNYPDESVSASLYYSGNMYPPLLLTEKIDHELTILRRQWADSLPVVEIPFFIPWRTSYVQIGVDSTYLDSFLMTTCSQVKALQQKYSLSMRRSYSWTNKYVTVTAPLPLNSARLAEEFIGQPGVFEVHTNEVYPAYSSVLLRSEYGGEVHYFVKSEACPDLYWRYDHFVVDRRRAVHIGTHWQCPPNVDSMYFILPFEEFMKWQEAWIDSAAAHQPIWMSAAYTAVQHWTYDSGVHWYRPQD